MKRRWFRVLLALLVLLAALGAGAAAVALSTAPAFIAGAMTQLLGRHVSIGNIRIHAGLRMQVDLAQVRIHATADPASPVQLEAPRAAGSQAWPRVLVGQLVPLSWAVDSPILRLKLPADVGEQLELRALDLAVSAGRVELQTPQGPFVVTGLDLEISSGALLPTLEGSARGELRSPDRALGRFDLSFSGGLDRTRVRGQLQDVDLAGIGLPGMLAAGGKAAGSFSADLDDGELAGSCDLELKRLQMHVPGLDADIAPRAARLAGSGRWHDGQLELDVDVLALDDLLLQGPLTVNTAGDGRVRLSLAVGPFEPGKPAQGRINPISLLGRRFATLGRIHDRLEGGRAEGRVEVDLPLAGMASLLSFQRPLRPEQFSLELRAQGGVYRPAPDSEPFTGIDGVLAIEGDRFAMREVRLTRYGSALPLLDITIDGFSRLIHLPAQERYVPAGPDVDTPGLGAAFSSLLPAKLADSEAARAPSPVLRLREARLEHPALLLPIRDASAELRFPEGKLVADPIRGVVAGGAAEMSIEWDRARDHVTALLRYDYAAAGQEKAYAPAPDGEWLSGRIALERVQLGAWPLGSVDGRVRARGAQLALTELNALTSGGTLAASGDVSLATEGSAPISLDLELSDVDTSAVAGLLGLGADRITGRGGVRGPIRGTLSPADSFLAGAELQLELELRDGTLRELPVGVELARLPSLQGVLGLFGKPLPYRTIAGTLSIERGVLRTERLALLGPELRILAAGEVDLRGEQHTDMVVALLFAQTLDRVLEQVPVLGSWVLGDDESLFAVYVQVQGPWADPRVGLLPPNSLQAAAGWAGRMIGRGMRGLRDWVIPQGTPNNSPKQPAAPLGQ